jgi:outer membrane protein assembly factor BamB
MRHSRAVLLGLCLAGFLALSPFATVHAENWPQWRGPVFDGSSPETNLPTTFSKTENVKWSAPMPGSSAATPIVWGDRVFVSSTDAAAQTLVAMSFDRATGRMLWQRKVADGFGRDNRSNYSAPSPVTDGSLVWFYYGSGDLAAFDFEGNPVWSRNIQRDEGQFAFQWTYAASPLLLDGRLYIQVLQRDVPVNGRGRTDGPNDSYVLALDPRTGETLWKHVRPSTARAESLEAFTTPVPAGAGSSLQLLIAGGDALTGHNPVTGEELWRWENLNPDRIGHWRVVPSPVSGAGITLICGPKGEPVYAFKLGLRGTVDDSALAWKSTEREVSTDVSTPLFYNGKFFVLNSDRKTIAKLDPATGAVEWIGDLASRAKIEASPTGADGKIYFQSHSGEAFVVSAGDEFKILHRVEMGASNDRDTRSSIAVSGGNLFIRTAGSLYCVGE